MNMSLWIDKYFWLWLFRLKGFGSKKVLLLRSAYIDNGLNFEQLYSLIKKHYGISVPNRIAIETDVKAFLEGLDKNCVFIKPLWDNDYPFLLKQIPDPPAFLFCKGKEEFLTILNKKNYRNIVSIVGTRRISSYGKEVIKILVEPLFNTDVVIVSGLAQGIDGFVHEHIINSELAKVIAVLPGGPLEGYPFVNRKLYENICRRGLIISEYYPGIMLTKGMFASRNRIIAGISNLTVVIEAPLKSGALITADLALQYNRDVGAIPGSIFSRNSMGTNNLIKSGAFLIQSGIDILKIVDKGNCLYDSESYYYKDVLNSNLIDFTKGGISKHRLESVMMDLEEGVLSVSSFIKKLGVTPSMARVFLTKMEIKGILRLERSGLVKLVRNSIEISNC